jgi:hypothetical protein
LHVATVLEDPGVFPTWSRQTVYRVPVVQVEEVPQTHTLLRQRFDKTSPPQGSDVPHLHVFRPTQVSVVKVHAGLQRAKAKKTENSKYSNLFCDIMKMQLGACGLV